MLGGHLPEDGTSLFVYNLTDKVKRDLLKINLAEFFLAWGRVVEVRVYGPWSNPHARGKAVVTFETVVAAELAMKMANGKLFLGREVKIKVVNQREEEK